MSAEIGFRFGTWIRGSVFNIVKYIFKLCFKSKFKNFQNRKQGWYVQFSDCMFEFVVFF